MSQGEVRSVSAQRCSFSICIFGYSRSALTQTGQTPQSPPAVPGAGAHAGCSPSVCRGTPAPELPGMGSRLCWAEGAQPSSGSSPALAAAWNDKSMLRQPGRAAALPGPALCPAQPGCALTAAAGARAAGGQNAFSPSASVSRDNELLLAP